MPRPQRIQYENAFYHVMNRGRGRQTIFHDEGYYRAFLKTLEEAYKRFDAVFHAYCLMGNHYHLLIETPRANLDRIMRHINGVYTQHYNRLRKADGPLFRGRYRAILAEKDAYLLQLTRYIHRNPVETKRPQVDDLADYPWSSYPAYINRARAEHWLQREYTYQLLGQRQKYVGYKSYVELGIDEELKRLYSRKNTMSVLGDRTFRMAIAEDREHLGVNAELSKILSERPSGNDIVAAVAKVFKVTEGEIVERRKGRQRANLPRKVAIYCCQRYGDMTLKSIAEQFGLAAESSVSPAVRDVKSLLKQGKLKTKLAEVKMALNYIQ